MTDRLDEWGRDPDIAVESVIAQLAGDYEKQGHHGHPGDAATERIRKTIEQAFVPRVEHEAAIAAAVQAAAFSCEAKAERILRIRNSREGFQSVLLGEINVLHDAAREIRSLATLAQQNALRERIAEERRQEAEANHGDWIKLLLDRDDLPLPTTPQGVVKEHDAKVIDAAFVRLWELMRDGWETQRAMDKVKLTEREIRA